MWDKKGHEKTEYQNKYLEVFLDESVEFCMEQNSNFYFRFLRDNHGKDEHYWSKALDIPARRSWAGLTFEQVCKDHINQIKKKLGISGVLTEEYIWFARGDADLGVSGAQIDLLLERRDRIINICEIKFSSEEYIIDKDYDLNLRN